MNTTVGTLYIVATPIGNLGDLSQRAIETLKNVDLIAAEDTRHSRTLLQQFAIQTSVTSLHEHNERKLCEPFISRLQAGASIALISDAGTPLISDPGYHFVRQALQHSIPVIPVPGPSTLSAALSVAGQATDSVLFVGFLPAKTGTRRRRLTELAPVTASLVIFEAPHRIDETVDDLIRCLGGQREVTFMRELTKRFETIRLTTLNALKQLLVTDSNQHKGEMVLVIQGAPATDADDKQFEGERVLKILLKTLSIKQAASLAAEITGARKNVLYQSGLSLKQE